MNNETEAGARGGVSAEEVDAAAESNAPVNDIEDTEQELAGVSSSLRDALACFRGEFAGLFNRNDAAALRQQRWHRAVIRIFSVSGTLAVVFSILHLVRLLKFDESPEVKAWLAHLLFFGELFFVWVAVAAFCIGLLRAFQGHWLEYRHKAEMLRLLKFRALIDAAKLGNDPAAFARWKSGVMERARDIERMNEDTLHEWVEEARMPDLPPTPVAHGRAGLAVEDLLDYYKKKRLLPQTRYFYKQANSNQRWDWSTRLLPPVLFVLSVLCALLHLLYEVYEFTHEGREAYVARWTQDVSQVSVALIILAAILPVIGAGLRGLRSAFEYSRNTLRFRALHFALEMLNERLGKETAPEEILSELFWCEWMIEAEHREWLRLMIEAEWAG
jgi:hypothetical protein